MTPPAPAADDPLRSPLRLEREFAAPRPLLWAVWTDPHHLARWWGPNGFTNPVCEFDARPGGAIRIDMRAPDGTVHAMDGTVHECVPNERLVLRCRALDAKGRPILEVETEVTFRAVGAAVGTAAGERTRVVLQARVLTATGDGRGAAAGMQQGWEQSFERLGTAALEAGNDAPEREIVLSRVFAAPPAEVYAAWTTPERVAQWWGPAGFSLTTHSMRVAPGEVWRYTMHGPDGRDYENEIAYLEVQAPHRLLYQHGGDKDTEPVRFRVEVTFTAENGDPGRTRVVMRSTFPSNDALQFVLREYGALEGGRQHLARLGEHLGDPLGGGAPGEVPFAITRVVRAPLALVWDVWTRQEHLQRWFGPQGAVMPECALDLRPGGSLRYTMRVPDGTELRGMWQFREVVERDRLVFLQAFADAAGAPARNPWDASWPLWTLATVTFRAHAGKGHGTVVTVRWAPHEATAAERATFLEGHASMQQGWSGTFAQLDDYLRSVAGASIA
ncbi:MAG: SRPBCC domain-containing protein [Planctomycetota bacterium]